MAASSVALFLCRLLTPQIPNDPANIALAVRQRCSIGNFSGTLAVANRGPPNVCPAYFHRSSSDLPLSAPLADRWPDASTERQPVLQEPTVYEFFGTEYSPPHIYAYSLLDPLLSCIHRAHRFLPTYWFNRVSNFDSISCRKYAH